MSHDEVLRRLKEEIEKHGNAHKLGEHYHVSPCTIRSVVSGWMKPTPAVLAMLGLKKVVSYEPMKPMDEKRSDA